MQLSKRSLPQLQSRQSAQSALPQVRSPARQRAAQLSPSVPQSHCVESIGRVGQVVASWVMAVVQSGGSTQWVHPF